ncbi:hypothetical protein BC833DRAFT_565211 [Globomyces pollinis-pini]|nr:hypothetical protein BC833DRAFT_565211 [Globomyces pollinis-pini]
MTSKDVLSSFQFLATTERQDVKPWLKALTSQSHQLYMRMDGWIDAKSFGDGQLAYCYIKVVLFIFQKLLWCGIQKLCSFRHQSNSILSTVAEWRTIPNETMAASNTKSVTFEKLATYMLGKSLSLCGKISKQVGKPYHSCQVQDTLIKEEIIKAVVGVDSSSFVGIATINRWCMNVTAAVDCVHCIQDKSHLRHFGINQSHAKRLEHSRKAKRAGGIVPNERFDTHFELCNSIAVLVLELDFHFSMSAVTIPTNKLTLKG